MSASLSDSTIAIVKSTGPALRQHGVAITTAMYARLFQDAEVKRMFDQAAQVSGEQPKRLAAAILGYAENIDKLGALDGAVARMVARHVQTGVKPEHYPKVAVFDYCLLQHKLTLCLLRIYSQLLYHLFLQRRQNI